MSTRTQLAATFIAVAGLAFPVMGQAQASPAVRVDDAKPTITITPQTSEPAYVYNPAQLSAKAGQPITITNNDPEGVHSVTAKDRSFSVDVPPKGSVTLTVSKAGTYQYFCSYHPGQHNPATLTIS